MPAAARDELRPLAAALLERCARHGVTRAREGVPFGPARDRLLRVFGPW